MLLINIQENIIKCNAILTSFENDGIYKTYKMVGGHGRFENMIRGILQSTIKLRNQLIVDIEAIVISTNNKDLIQMIESDFFKQITEAASKDSLIRIVNLNNITIPNTALNVIGQNDNVIRLVNKIALDVDLYNSKITDFRQKWNKFKITLYSFPNVNEYPNVIENQINLQSLLFSSPVPINSAAINQNIASPKNSNILYNAKPKTKTNKSKPTVNKNTSSSKIDNITNKF